MPIEKSGDTVEFINGQKSRREAAGVVIMGASILMTPAAAWSIATTPASANLKLTAGTRAISIYARGGDICFAVGSGAQRASAASHYLAAGERFELDISKFDDPNIAAITGPSGAAATLHVSELV